MPVEMFIRGREQIIRLEDWLHAIQSRNDLRVNAAASVMKNPKTGAELRVPGNAGDVEYFFEDTNQWIKVFSWHDGAVVFRATGKGNAVLQAAFEIAESLGAEVTDEEGNVCE